MNRDVEKTKDGNLIIRIDKSLYEKLAVLRTSYIFQDQCYVRVKSLSDSTFEVTFSKKDDVTDYEIIAKNFFNELIDQQIRLENERMYGNLRREIVQQAFKPIHYEKLKLKFNNES